MKWVSVNDRLPENDNDYLVCNSENEFQVIEYRKLFGWDRFASYWCPEEITHWMPLPDPPQE